MKKKIQSAKSNLAKFESSKIAALSTICGGVKGGATTSSIGYDTVSSESDLDRGDHDSDAGS